MIKLFLIYLHEPLLHLGVERLHDAVLADEEAALLHDDLGGALGVHPEAARVKRHDGAHRLPRAVEGVDLPESGVWHLPPYLHSKYCISGQFSRVLIFR